MEIEELNELIDDFEDVKYKVCVLEERFNNMDSFLVTPLDVSKVKCCLSDIYIGIEDVNKELTDIKHKAPTTESDCQ